MVLTSDINIRPGQYAVCSRVLMRVPTCDGLLGRIVDPLGILLMLKGLYPQKDLGWLNL